MFSRDTQIALLAGMAAGILFAISAYSVGGGMLLMYLPSLPLLCVGLMVGVRRVFIASLIACVLIGILTADARNALFFAVFTVIPVLYFVHQALLWREDNNWYPVLSILAELTLIIALFFLMLFIVAGNYGGLQTIITQGFSSELTVADPEVSRIMNWLITDGSFLLIACSGWSWVLTLYGFAVLANALLKQRGVPLRASLALTPVQLPAWLLVVVLINGAAAFFLQGTDRFVAETVFLLLLLPYFLTGLALLHRLAGRWRHKVIWLMMFYILLIFQVWIVPVMTVIGLYYQLAEMLDKHRQIR